MSAACPVFFEERQKKGDAKMENTNHFTRGKVLSPLIRFALPILFAIFLQTMYGAVDMLIVGQFSHAGEVSAVSTGSWIMQTVTSFITGLAMGTTVLLGNRIGAGKAQEGGRVVGASILLFLAIGAVLTVALELFAVPFARMMQAPPEAFDSTVQYVRICGAGTLFIIAFNVLGGVFRGIGNAKLPLISVAIACVANIAGDLLLVGGLGWGCPLQPRIFWSAFPFWRLQPLSMPWGLSHQPVLAWQRKFAVLF